MGLLTTVKPPALRGRYDFAIGDDPSFRVTPREVALFWDRYLERLQNPSYGAIKQGLSRAVHQGTASRAGVQELEILGKTGTADSLRQSYKTLGWFLGAYPIDQPRFALVVFLTRAYGFEEAASLGGKIFSLAGKLGVME